MILHAVGQNQPTSLPEATIKFAREAGLELTPQIKVTSFEDLQHMRGSDGVGYHRKKLDGSLSNGETQQQNVPSEVYVEGSVRENGDDPNVDGGPEVYRFIGQLTEQGNTWERFLELEIIHSHPYFELVNAHGQILNLPLSKADLKLGVEISTGVLSGALVIITAVVPNGYRYSAAFHNGRNITEEIFK